MNSIEILSGPVTMNLHKYLVKNPISTFFGRISGHSLREIGIDEGDVLIIDKSLPWRDNALAVCVVEGAFTLRRMNSAADKVLLMPAAGAGKSIEAVKHGDVNREPSNVWGIVAHVIKQVLK